MSSSGKSSSRLDQHAQVDQFVGQRVDGLRELTLQGTHGRAGGAHRGRVDQVGDGFRLRQIYLAVEKGAATEFAGFGQPGAEIEAAGKQHLHDDRAAVAL